MGKAGIRIDHIASLFIYYSGSGLRQGKLLADEASS
jgi:hypothetical protein